MKRFYLPNDKEMTMSWSVGSVGKPAAVKAALAAQFDRAKQSTAGIPHECESVGLIEQIVNGQLDFLTDLPGVAVTVAASGSAYKSLSATPPTGNSSVSLSVTPIYGFAD